jgi:acyl-coenzyme A thioesterase 9
MGSIGPFCCSDVADESSRPPLLVTAGVEAIELRSSQLSLEKDMRMSGQVVWAGSSSVEIRLELEQVGAVAASVP